MVSVADLPKRISRKLKIPSFVRGNLEYYKAMARMFPEEQIWKKAIKDSEEILK